MTPRKPLALQWGMASTVTVGDRPWGPYRSTVREADGETVVEVDSSSDRRVGLRRLPQVLVANRDRDEALAAQDDAVIERETHLGVSGADTTRQRSTGRGDSGRVRERSLVSAVTGECRGTATTALSEIPPNPGPWTSTRVPSTTARSTWHRGE